MMVGAKEPKVFRSVVPRISVDVIDMNRDAASMRVTFVPSAHAALFAVGRDHIRPDVTRRLVKTRCRPLDLTGKPSPDVLFVVKGSATPVRTVDERIFSDNIVAAISFALNDFF
jgi:hypothetical protein